MPVDDYSILKLVHITTVICSITLFLLRAVILIRTSKLSKSRWLKILPHFNDTVLLLSALSMLYLASLMPDFEHSWLLAKIIAMLIYIMTGMYLFKFADNQRSRIITTCLAVIIFGYIIHTALMKTPVLF